MTIRPWKSRKSLLKSVDSLATAVLLLYQSVLAVPGETNTLTSQEIRSALSKRHNERSEVNQVPV